MRVILCIIYCLLAPSITYAESLNTSENVKFPITGVTAMSGTSKGWGQFTKIDHGIQLSFFVRYYLKKGGKPAKLVRAFFQNHEGILFKSNEIYPSFGIISSNNVSASAGLDTFSPMRDVELFYTGLSWQKYPCTSVSCEEPVHAAEEMAINGQGYPLGTIDASDNHYSGSVIISYIACAKDANFNRENFHHTCEIKQSRNVFGFISCRPIYEIPLIGRTCVDLAQQSPLGQLGYTSAFFVILFGAFTKLRNRKKT